MRFSLFHSLPAVALLGAMTFAVPATAQNAAFSEPQRQAIGEIVREYLLKNPEVITEVIAELEKRQADAQRVSQAGALKETRQTLLNSPHSLVVGNPTGDVTLVEFFDYNCGYCKKALGGRSHPHQERPEASDRAEGFPRSRPGFGRGEPRRPRGQEPAPGREASRLPRQADG